MKLKFYFVGWLPRATPRKYYDRATHDRANAHCSIVYPRVFSARLPTPRLRVRACGVPRTRSETRRHDAVHKLRPTICIVTHLPRDTFPLFAAVSYAARQWKKRGQNRQFFSPSLFSFSFSLPLSWSVAAMFLLPPSPETESTRSEKGREANGRNFFAATA